ncbi:unnamed protein product [Closterium sp. NIES-64]|nr:unnamed protein product [Closterium sp. NIES-64]
MLATWCELVPALPAPRPLFSPSTLPRFPLLHLPVPPLFITIPPAFPLLFPSWFPILFRSFAHFSLCRVLSAPFCRPFTVIPPSFYLHFHSAFLPPTVPPPAPLFSPSFPLLIPLLPLSSRFNFLSPSFPTPLLFLSPSSPPPLPLLSPSLPLPASCVCAASASFPHLSPPFALLSLSCYYHSSLVFPLPYPLTPRVRSQLV